MGFVFSVPIAFVIIFLIAILMFSGVSTIITTQKVSAQITSDNMAGTAGSNETLMTMSGSNSSSQNMSSSIKILPTLVHAIISQVNVSLVQATMSAEKAIGDNSHPVAAMLRTQNGYLVYTVWILDVSDNIHQVFVDPGNGKVLAQMPSITGPTILDPSTMGITNQRSATGARLGMMGKSYP
jgi:hypothetical protein